MVCSLVTNQTKTHNISGVELKSTPAVSIVVRNSECKQISEQRLDLGFFSFSFFCGSFVSWQSADGFTRSEVRVFVDLDSNVSSHEPQVGYRGCRN